MAHFVGDIGTVFRARITDENGIVNLTGATVTFNWEAPDGTLDTHSASLTSASKGLADYTVTSGDLDQSGTWRFQAKVELGGNTWYSEIKDFEVNAVLA